MNTISSVKYSVEDFEFGKEVPSLNEGFSHHFSDKLLSNQQDLVFSLKSGIKMNTAKLF